MLIFGLFLFLIKISLNRRDIQNMKKVIINELRLIDYYPYCETSLGKKRGKGKILRKK
jgi:hypothetical protein